MRNEKFRKFLEQEFDEVVVFDNFAYDESVVGITADDRVVYDYNSMIEELVKYENMTYDEAIEWIDYNTMRALPHGGPNAPIVIVYNKEDIMDRME